MAEITLPVDTGRPLGTRAARRLRAEGKVPGVVYGLGSEPVPVSVDWKDLRAALTTDAGLNALLQLELSGESHLSIVKEIQREPISKNVRHVDFLLIEAGKAISVDVPVVLVGEATEVVRENGNVDHVMFQLTVNAKPADIPNEITVDISGLQIGSAIRVGDLALPSGVTTDLDDEEPIVLGQAPAAEVPEAPAEGEELEGEGEGAEAGAAESGGEAEAAEGGEG